ncbi:DUF1298 domain-containing protein [Thalassotalea sp. M1531]|uniref:diacylglycerol O-acyltransferase n=1 Tax=Thalassotalea algicola TaxID=2716224 RepID=A0A7Y0LA48_9GAMM|nr:wax ester/triacylglycerol synthase domain-containing protein [Thalassotalea algicola]NMP30774.1 DUF1298 domain-containing protein [Thalassotalea algicola]
MAKRLSFLDWSFWLTETRNNPKHVAAFQVLKKPKSAKADYCKVLSEELKQHDKAYFPFNCRIFSFFRFALGFRKVKKMDMDYHVKYHKVDDVNDVQALHRYIAKIHEHMLDRDKPLWQIHLVDDEKSETYAAFLKVHHLYGDGASLVKWFKDSYQSSPSDKFTPIWSAKRKRKAIPKKNPYKTFFTNAWHFLVILFDIAVIHFRLLLKFLRIYPVYMPLPFSGTKTVLTGQVSAGRVVATTQIDFDEVRKLAHRMRASANEVILCCFDIGIHKFLKGYGQQFDKPLITQMPINMRKPNDPVGGNKIAIVPVELAHGKKDPYLRLRQIIENHRIVKGVAKRVYPASFSYYTILIQGMALVLETIRLSALFRPIGNILISNMPGPAEAKYFKDSKLEALYPISTLTPGGGVNITMITYCNNLDIGLVCCDKDIKSLEPLAEYFHEAFELLQQCVDNPDLTIDDLGEIRNKPVKSLLEDHFTHKTSDAEHTSNHKT